MKYMKFVLASALALSSAPAFASIWTEGGGFALGYSAAYQAAIADAAEVCVLMGGTAGPTVQVLDATPAGGGYYSVLVQRICFGV
jgi:hypothetical protein